MRRIATGGPTERTAIGDGFHVRFGAVHATRVTSTMRTGGAVPREDCGGSMTRDRDTVATNRSRMAECAYPYAFVKRGPIHVRRRDRTIRRLRGKRDGLRHHCRMGQGRVTGAERGGINVRTARIATDCRGHPGIWRARTPNQCASRWHRAPRGPDAARCRPLAPAHSWTGIVVAIVCMTIVFIASTVSPAGSGVNAGDVTR